MIDISFGYDKVNRTYPDRVYYKKQEFLTLNYNEHQKAIITALTPQEYEAIVLYGKKNIILEDKPNSIRFGLRSRTMLFKGHTIPVNTIHLIADKEYSAKCVEFVPTKVINEKTYYYNYGSKLFCYYGVGIEEKPACWATIKQVVGITDYFMIFLTK